MRYHPDQNIQLSNTPPTILIPSRENLMKLEVWNGKPGLDSYIAGWWDHLHQHQPTESGGGHCRVWKQVVGTKSLVRKLKLPFSGGTWSMPWTSWTGRSWTGGGSGWLKRVAAGGPGPGLGPDLGPEPGQGPGNPKMITSNEIMRW